MIGHRESRLRPSVSLFAWMLAATALFAQPGLQTPSEVSVGSEFDVTWTGTGNQRDFISIDEQGWPDSKYGPYIYARAEGAGKLRAPGTPGTFLVRYHSAENGYAVLDQREITVVDATAELTIPSSVAAGDTLTIEWQGPANRGDFISIDQVGAEDREYGTYAYTRSNPVEIRAPEDPGSYVVRYHLSTNGYRVIGSAPVDVTGVEATVSAPASVQAGGKVEVTWNGPDNQGDYLSIDPEGAPEREYGPYAYTRHGSPATIAVPDEPGSYVIRYHMGKSYKVIAESPLEVKANTATISGPASVPAGSAFAVTWTGPANDSDYVTIVPKGSGNRTYLSYAYTRAGSPAELEAPLDLGAHELRYVTGRSRQILAAADIEVGPGAVPGTLSVTGDLGSGGAAAAGAGAVELILDASGSMLKRLDGTRRIEIAKRALSDLVDGSLTAGTPFALRVFGHKEVDSCRTDLEIPLAPLSVAQAKQKIEGIEAMNLAKTPIAASLLAVKDDLAGVEGPVTVVLVTDGEETCDGDSKEAIAELERAGFSVRVNIVGFAIDDMLLKEQFEDWARAGGGRYLDVGEADQLGAAISRSLEVFYEVRGRGSDDVVASGVVNGDPVSLLPGAYSVRVLTIPPRELGEVTVEARETASLAVE